MVKSKNWLNSLKLLTNIIIFIFFTFEINSSECPEFEPILLQNNTCDSLYCSESQFQSHYCTINNTKIKTQWLTNIIIFGELNFRYINFATYSNGDFIVETTASPVNKKRIFYGLKKNGRDLFKNDSKETPFYSITVQNQENGKKYEGEIIIAKLNEGDDKDKEYIVSMSKGDTYAELYDYDNDMVYQNKMSVLGMSNENIRQASLSILSSDNLYYSFYGVIEDEKFILFNFSFPTINSIEEGLSPIKKEIADAKGLSISCFETEKKKIICFFYNEKENPTIWAMDNNLNLIKHLSFNKRDYYSKDSFIKCIYYINEIGVFSYYDNVSYDDDIHPYIYFKELKDNGLLVNPIAEIPQNYVILDLFLFKSYSSMNDMTKISDTKICFTTIEDSHETLYVIVLSIINLKNIKIRYYSFDIYKLLNYKFLSDMKSYTYNQFVVIGGSVCRQKVCESDIRDPHFSSLIFLSYPNSTDANIEISEYLFNYNEIDIDNLEIDLKEYIKIENNIFGLIFDGIQINNISNNDNFKLYSAKENIVIYENYTLEIDENIKIKFENNNYLKDSCSFEYNFIVTEPDRDLYDNYTVDIEENYGDDTEDFFNSDKRKYIGRTSYFKIYLKDNLNKECIDSECYLCFSTSPETCITCKSDYYFALNNDGARSKYCNHSISETSYLNIISTIKKNTDFQSESENNILSDAKSWKVEDDNENCSIDRIINNFCKNVDINNNQNEKVYIKLKEECLNLECAIKNKIVTTKNIIYQISTIENQQYDNYTFISSIDLGDCENKLREINKMSDNDKLIIYKRDIKNGITTYVEYEIYNSNNSEILSLDYCNDTKISINIPVNLKKETESLYESLNQYGYNLFNENDSFYNDICSTYTTEFRTDILLLDRKEDIFKNNGNLILCQKGCEFNSYNLNNRKAKCYCYAQQINKIETKNIDSYNKFDKKEFGENFYKTLKNSNFLVLKCFKLVFSFKNFFVNKGRLIMTIFFLAISVLIIFCNIFELKKINEYISNIMKNKIHDITNITNISNKKESTIRSIIFKPLKNRKRKLKKIKSIKTLKKKKNDLKSSPPKKSKNLPKDNKINLINPEKDIKESNKENINIKGSSFNDNIFANSKGILNNSNKSININSKNINIKRHTIKSKTYKQKTKLSLKPNGKSNINIIYNDRELNSLTYKEALIYDKRTYCEYYKSLLKQKHLILFSFCPDDYNLYTIKIILFLLSFSIYFSINGFFFSDDTMHKVYVDRGVFNLIFQIPQIIYSSLVSTIINTILRLLSLSEKSILKIKQEKNYNLALQKSKEIKICLFLKFIIFFVLSILLSIFFWYFISCFCAVFTNTQNILIKDTFLSFGLSMVYPLGLYLLPGFFRIPALKAINKDKESLYKFSTIVAIF